MAKHNRIYSDEQIATAKRLMLEGMSVKDVAQLTGIVKGTVYNYRNELIREFQRLIDKLRGGNGIR